MRLTRHRRLPLTALPLAALLAFAPGCVNPFKPADPEIGVGVITVKEDFSSGDSLLATLARAISAKTNGTSAYLRSLAEASQPGDLSFLAYHDKDMKAVYTGEIKEPWTIEDERGVPASLAALRSQDDYEFKFIEDPGRFANDDYPSNSADTGHVQRRYQLTARDPASGDDTSGEIIVIGYADLSLRKDKATGRWAIFRWVDFVDERIGALPAADAQRCFSYRRLKSLVARP